MARPSVENENFLIINNVKMPIPAPSMTIDSAIGVDAGRNAKNYIVDNANNVILEDSLTNAVVTGNGTYKHKYVYD